MIEVFLFFILVFVILLWTQNSMWYNDKKSSYSVLKTRLKKWWRNQRSR